MAKLVAFSLACFLALLAIGSAFRTTITTTVMEEAQQDCQQQYQQQQQLYHCKMYLSQRRSNPQWDEQEEHLNDCCRQLENVSERCRCEIIKQMVQEQQQLEGRYEAAEAQEMLQKAHSLPQRCNTEPGQCQIRAVFL